MCNTCRQNNISPEFETIFHSEEEYKSHDGEIRRKYMAHDGELANIGNQYGNSEYETVGTEHTWLRRTDTTIAPFRYICQIVSRLSDGNDWVGTGFFVGPKTILTAGHVIWDKFSNTKVTNANITVTPARNGTTEPFSHFTPVNVVTSYAGYSRADYVTGMDYAIIHLGTEVGNTTGYFGRGVWAKDSYGSSILKDGKLPAAVGTLTVNLCGYPIDSIRGLNGILQYSSYNNTFSKLDGGRVLTYLNDTKGGQSGGPVWMKRSPSLGGRVIVGIHVGRGDYLVSPPGTVGYNKAVFLTPDVKKFIDANLR